MGNLNPGSDPDLVVPIGNGGASVLIGGPGGSFAAPVAFPAGLSTSGVAVGDFNADSKTDIVAANWDSETSRC